MTAADDPDWWKDALCAQIGDQMFFPDPGDLGQIRAAKQICSACDVAGPCLEDALRIGTYQDRYGIRAGLSPAQRDRLRRQQARGEAA